MSRSLARWCGRLGAGLLLGMAVACGATEVDQEAVRSHLEGHFIVSAEVDSTPDYRGFEILVLHDQAGAVDTLGYAETDSTGAFALDVTAPDRGVYPLLVSRRGTVLKVDELAVADGDSAIVTATFPIGNRPLRVRSTENDAWMAFRNTRSQYRRTLVDLVQRGPYDDEEVRSTVLRTSAILWSMRDTYPKTIGRDLAEAEAVVMLGGWDDSLAVVWAHAVEPDNLGYPDVVRVARLAQARLDGPGAAVRLVQDFLARVPEGAPRASLQAELVLAYIAAEEREAALATARAMEQADPASDWAEWAGRAIYELETLMPGMEAPPLRAQTLERAPVVLDSLRGNVVVLEYYAPRNAIFQRDLAERHALAGMADSHPFRWLSISVDPDTLVSEAFFEGRDVPGVHIIAPGGLDGLLARTYNVNVLPTRFLIDREGKIVGKYVGASLPALRRDVEALLGAAR